MVGGVTAITGSAAGAAVLPIVGCAVAGAAVLGLVGWGLIKLASSYLINNVKIKTL
jgi:hypothetical protein